MFYTTDAPRATRQPPFARQASRSAGRMENEAQAHSGSSGQSRKLRADMNQALPPSLQGAQGLPGTLPVPGACYRHSPGPEGPVRSGWIFMWQPLAWEMPATLGELPVPADLPQPHSLPPKPARGSSGAQPWLQLEPGARGTVRWIHASLLVSLRVAPKRHWRSLGILPVSPDAQLMCAVSIRPSRCGPGRSSKVIEAPGWSSNCQETVRPLFFFACRRGPKA